MVVMVTPVAFANIGYQTYIIFAVINLAMVPSVYFFFPETAGRSLEEMDEIFHKTTNPFDVVKVAHGLPRRYGKRGELLINYEDTEEARDTERRRSSVTGATHGVGRGGLFAREEEKEGREHREKTDEANGHSNGGAL
jgi:hypothetical protein